MPTLEWIGKSKVINHHQEVPFRVLERKYSFDENGEHSEDNGSDNMIIRGDNLEALKALLPRYEGRVKCIYIDPPYNTGNEGWVYNDNVNDPKIKKWLGEVVGKEGEDLTRHDKWLCMMYPRLKLLQKLLADDGVIFISIDDTEFANLRLICDEVFGLRNFLADVIWEKSDSPRMDAKVFSTRHDHTITYAKNIETLSLHRIHTDEVPEHYNKIEDDGRRYYLKPLRAMGQNDAREARPNLYYAMIAPDGSDVFPVRTDGSDGNWRWSKQKVAENPTRIEWVNGRNGWTPYYKIYAEEQTERPPETIWYNKDVGSNRTSMNQIKAIFQDGKTFDTPKPVGLVERMLEIASNKDSIILDSFAGSGTTAHAVLNMNKADGGHRKFIMVQLPEACDEKSEARKAGYKNICEIGKERIRRAGRKIQDEAGLTAQNLDVGFRVLRLDSSNMQDVYYNPADLDQTKMVFLADNIKPDRMPEDLLFQVMLELGVLPSSPIVETLIDGKRVFDVADGFLLACFDAGVTTDTVTAIAKRQPYYAVFRDSSMADDSVATNFDQIFETYSPSTVRKVL